MRIVTVVGARPQFIKAAPVSRALRAAGHEETLVHTGQHYDDSMSRRIIEEAGLPECLVNLNIGSGSHADQVGAIARGVAAIVVERRPRLVLVHGDTNSTLGGAMGAVAARCPLAHGESGLRSHDLKMPEEVNRIVTDHLSDLLIVPTRRVALSLEKERPRGRVAVGGDPMLDSLDGFRPDPQEMSRVGSPMAEGPFYLATIHRAENTATVSVLLDLLSTLAGLPHTTILPLHPRARSLLGDKMPQVQGRLRIVDPIGRGTTLELARKARAVLTDSGGLQREAYYLSVPCIVLRESTEWTETVEDGWAALAGRDPLRIREACESPPRGTRPPDLRGFGGGKAGELWCRAIEETFP